MGHRDNLIAGYALPKNRLRLALFELLGHAGGIDIERTVYRRNIDHGVKLTKTTVTCMRLIVVNWSLEREVSTHFFAVTARRIIH